MLAVLLCLLSALAMDREEEVRWSLTQQRVGLGLSLVGPALLLASTGGAPHRALEGPPSTVQVGPGETPTGLHTSDTLAQIGGMAGLIASVSGPLLLSSYGLKGARDLTEGGSAVSGAPAVLSFSLLVLSPVLPAVVQEVAPGQPRVVGAMAVGYAGAVAAGVWQLRRNARTFDASTALSLRPTTQGLLLCGTF